MRYTWLGGLLLGVASIATSAQAHDRIGLPLPPVPFVGFHHHGPEFCGPVVRPYWGPGVCVTAPVCAPAVVCAPPVVYSAPQVCVPAPQVVYTQPVVETPVCVAPTIVAPTVVAAPCIAPVRVVVRAPFFPVPAPFFPVPVHFHR
jgi:hypothetical protein